MLQTTSHSDLTIDIAVSVSGRFILQILPLYKDYHQISNMYRHSPIRNPRSKGIKTKNVLQVCLLLAVCFWLIFQVKRSHDKKKEFDNTNISLTTSKQSTDESLKLGRKDLQPKLQKEIEIIHEEQDEEQNEEHEEQDEGKIDEEKEDGGGGGDDEIDENEQEKSDVEVVDREESEVIDEESQTQNNEVSVDNNDDDHEENGASIHTDEGREEHYKADDASSAVVTQIIPENGTLEETPNTENVNNQTSFINRPPSNTIITKSETLNVTGEQSAPNQIDIENDEGEIEGESEGEKLEGREEILDPDEVENETHLEEKEVRMDLDTLPEIEIETEGEDSAVERR
ncbi:hypothetical protein LXL04_038527 [Taraxacum kok-saghyz]